MSDGMDAMLGAIPLVVLGGATLMFTERFINKPYGRKYRKRIDKQYKRDWRDKEIKFGDFSNIGW